MTKTPTRAADRPPGRPWLWLATGLVVAGVAAVVTILATSGDTPVPGTETAVAPTPATAPGGATPTPATPAAARAPVIASVRIVWPGATTEDVDALVAVPFETLAGTLAEVAHVRTVARGNEALIALTFGPATSPERALEQAQASVRRTSPRMPAEASMTAQAGDILGAPEHLLVLTSTGSAVELARLAREVLVVRLSALPGVSRVSVVGGPAEEVQVTLEMVKLMAYGLDVAAVVRAVAAPAGAPAGAVPGEAPVVLDGDGLELLRNVVVGEAGGAAVKLADVATLRVGPTAAARALRLDGQPAVGVSVSAAPGVTTAALVEAARAALPDGTRVAWSAGGDDGAAAAEGSPGLYVALRTAATAGAAALEGEMGALAAVEAMVAQTMSGAPRLAWDDAPDGPLLLVRGDWALKAAAEGAAQTLRTALAGVPGVETEVWPLAPNGLTPRRAPLVVSVTGAGEREALATAAQAVVEALREVPGVSRPWADVGSVRVREVRLDREALAATGVEATTATAAVAVVEMGALAARVRVGAAELPVRVAVDAANRGAVTVPGTGGRAVPLTEVARVEERVVPRAIVRQDGRLVVTVSARVAGSEIATVRAAVQARLGGLKLPAGVQATLE